jgi:predicted MPP superfamily phosphohydrolase
MAGTKKKPSRAKTAGKKKARPGWVKWVLSGIGALIGVMLVFMAFSASLVHIEYAEVYLDDLPKSFDGTRIVFVSDLDVDGFRGVEATKALMRQLSALQPDLLLLGGDYTSYDLAGGFAALLGAQKRDGVIRAEERRRNALFESFADFTAPYGKYAVAGNRDLMLEGLKDSAALGGCTLLQNNIAWLKKDGQRIVLMGLDDWTTGAQDVKEMAKQVSTEDCVIVVSHNPDGFPALGSVSCKDGAQWVDLMLSGHTHGGLINLPGIGSLANKSSYGDRYLSGWKKENGAYLLISNGVGSPTLPFRWNAPAQAHCITLRKK